MKYFVYIVECSDQSLYTGATNDLKKRIIEHNISKRGAQYTKIRRPVILKYSESFRTLARARRREAEIKGWKREEKLELLRAQKVLRHKTGGVKTRTMSSLL